MNWIERTGRLAGIVLGFGLPLLGPSHAHAEPSGSERALSEALFRQAKQLMADGQIREACSKFAESHRIDPGGGTLLNLAVCHEKDGKVATAWAEFKDALAYARTEGRTDRIELAEAHIRALEPLLPKLALAVAPDTCDGELTILIDGVTVRKPAWGAPMPFDPGAHVVDASCAAARVEAARTWSKRIELAPKASLRVDIPRFPPLTAVQNSDRSQTQTEDLHDPGSRQRLAGYIAVGTGVAALGLGTYFGVKAIDQHRQSDELCPSNSCDGRGLELNEDARRSARLSNISLGVGLVSAAVGAWLILSAPSPTKAPLAKRRDFRFNAFATHEGAMCGLAGMF